jgi:isocitrate lyase
LIWCETSEPDVEEARRFAEAIHAEFPGKLLAYNCSPSFNWTKKLNDETIANFQPQLAKMGYKFQFVTLAGFHALNLSMFELARGYKDSGMTAYSRLQEKEFSREADYGYQAVKHQRFVGTGYFDALTQVIAGGLASTTALNGSTEQEQFAEAEIKSKPLAHPKHCPDAACQPILVEYPSTSFMHEVMPAEESLLPSGD